MEVSHSVSYTAINLLTISARVTLSLKAQRWFRGQSRMSGHRKCSESDDPGVSSFPAFRKTSAGEMNVFHILHRITHQLEIWYPLHLGGEVCC